MVIFGINMLNKKKLAPGTILAAIIIILLIYNIDLDKLASLRLDFNWTYLCLAFIILIPVNLIRALRFNYLLDFSFKLTEIFSITAYYNFYTTIFPGGIGELSFVHLIRKNVNKNISHGLSAIFLTRVYDILLMLLFCGAVLPVIRFPDFNKEKLVLFIIGCIVVISLIAYYLDAVIQLVNRVFLFLANKTKSRWISRIRHILEQTGEILKQSKKKVKMVFLLSFFYWAVIFFVIQLLFGAIGINLNYFESVLLGTMTNLTTIIPFNTIGGFGYKEAGISLGLMILRIPKNEAIMISFVFHILSILLMTLLGFVGLLVKLITKKKAIIKYF